MENHISVIKFICLLVLIMGDRNNSQDSHAKRLHELCRICSKVIKAKDRNFEVKSHVEALNETFLGVNFNVDKYDIHPTNF